MLSANPGTGGKVGTPVTVGVGVGIGVAVACRVGVGVTSAVGVGVTVGGGTIAFVNCEIKLSQTASVAVPPVDGVDWIWKQAKVAPAGTVMLFV